MAGNFLSEWTSPSNARLVGYVIVPWRVFHLSRDSSKDFFRTNLNHQFIREVRYTLYCCRSFVEFHTYWQTIILLDTPMVIVLVELRVQEFTSNGNSRKQRGIRRHKNHFKKTHECWSCLWSWDDVSWPEISPPLPLILPSTQPGSPGETPVHRSFMSYSGRVLPMVWWGPSTTRRVLSRTKFPVAKSLILHLHEIHSVCWAWKFFTFAYTMGC